MVKYGGKPSGGRQNWKLDVFLTHGNSTRINRANRTNKTLSHKSQKVVWYIEGSLKLPELGIIETERSTVEKTN